MATSVSSIIIQSNTTITAAGGSPIFSVFSNTPLKLLINILGPVVGTLTVNIVELDPGDSTTILQTTSVVLVAPGVSSTVFYPIGDLLQITWTVSGGASFAGVYIEVLPSGPATDTSIQALIARSNTLGQKTMAGSAPVVIASDQSAIPVDVTDRAARLLGHVTVDSSALPSGAATAANQVTIAGDITSTQPRDVTDRAARLLGHTTVDNFPGTQPISGTVTSNQGTAAALAGAWPVEVTDGANVLGVTLHPIRVDPTGTTTQPISAAALPLPTGAATEATLGTRLADATFTGRINTQGQKTMAASTPVVVASDQSSLPVTVGNFPGTQPVSGAVTANQGTAAAIAASWPVEVTDGVNTLGVAAHPVRTDPTGTTTQPVSGTVTANIGTTGGLALDATLTSGAQKAQVTQATAANLLATVTQGPAAGAASPWSMELSDGAAFYTAAKTGQFPAALVGGRLDENVGSWLGSTAPTVGSKTSANSIPVVVASDQGAVPVSGTVTSNQGTAAALAGKWPVQVTDGTNTMPTADVAARKAFVALTDGTNTTAVKAALIAATTADPSAVVALSPNSPVPAGTNTIGSVDVLRGGVASFIASTSGQVQIAAAAGTTSLVYLFHSALSTKRIEISRIEVTFSPTGANQTGQLDIRGVFITAENATPGGTTPGVQPLDRSDSSDATDVFRVGATGAPVRLGFDPLTYAAGIAATFTWVADLTGKPIVLRSGVAEGFEIRAVVVTGLQQVTQAAVNFYWTEK